MASLLGKIPTLEKLEGHPCNVVALPHWHSICFLEKKGKS